MSLPKERIYYLLGAYTSKQASAAEEAELMDWVREAGENSELKNYMQAVWEHDWRGSWRFAPRAAGLEPESA